MTPVSSVPAARLIEPAELLSAPLRGNPLSTSFATLLSQALGLPGINRIYEAVAGYPPGIPFYEAILRELNVDLRVRDEDLRRIPATGPLVAVCNHPFGAIEGIVLPLVLERVRPDVRVMANFLLQRIPQLRERLIPVDPFGSPAAARRNLRGMRESLAWLRSGGALGLFPAGEVSHWNAHERRILDPAWSPHVARLIRHSGATTLPVYFAGSNGLGFQLAGMLHPRLRTAQLGNEFLRIRNRTLELRIGSPLPPAALHGLTSDEEATQLLRSRVYLLSNRMAPQSGRKLISLPPVRILPAQPATRAVAPAVPASLLQQAVESLPPSSCLATLNEFAVYLTTAQASPAILEEIGRLRELTFRDAGEGTGKARDLDRFDAHYQHLFVWHREHHEIVGAYRLALVQDVLRQRGVEHLYLSTLFRFEPAFFRHLGPAMELGRSFVRKEYQRSATPLMLLWKGIGAVVQRSPHCTRLLGPVSISNRYTECSRQILYDFLHEHCSSQELAGFVRPVRPFSHRRVIGWNRGLRNALLHEIEDVSRLIAELEADGKGVPVLLRQYLRLGGKILAFNVDPHFSHVLDGLILVDLRQTDPKVLARYMGKEGASAFLHASDNRSPAAP